jgi:uncharacterized membrane protein YkvA (DUF1232 family)
METIIEKWKQGTKKLKSETKVLYLAYKHPQTPWYAKAFAGLVVAYAFSPIDLIPDFIPVLGYLDDLILIPLGIGLAIKMIPASVMVDCRIQAEVETAEGKQTNWISVVMIILIWIILAALTIKWLAGVFK